MYHEGKFPIDKMTRFYKLTEFDQAVHAMWVADTRRSVCGQLKELSWAQSS
jgi:hypothetical protein